MTISKFFVIGRNENDEFILGCIKLDHQSRTAFFKKWKKISDVVDPKKFEKFLPLKKFTELRSFKDPVSWAKAMKNFTKFKQIWVHKNYVNRTT